jgi:hypothetical protein
VHLKWLNVCVKTAPAMSVKPSGGDSTALTGGSTLWVRTA